MNSVEEPVDALLAQPLRNTRIVEHCSQAAGSYLGRLLTLLGAEVVKVEDPGEQGLRAEPPLISRSPEMGALFAFLNAGKRSISLARNAQHAYRVRRDLSKWADAFIDDRPLSVRDHANESAEGFLQGNPRLVYVSILPFGGAGPNKHYLGEEINTFHACGEGNLLPNGLGNEMFPEREPIKAYGHLSEFQAGVGAAVALMAALFVRDSIGGQSIDVSVQDVNVALGGYSLQRYGDGTLETRHTRSFRYGGVLKCLDGYVELLVLEQHQWEALTVMLGSPLWAQKPEYAEPVERGKHGREINQHLREWAVQRSVDTIVSLSRQHGIPLGPYNAPRGILESAHEQERKFFTAFRHPNGKDGVMPNLPFKLLPNREWPARLSPPPALGEANELVFTEYLGYSEAELEAWQLEEAI